MTPQGSKWVGLHQLSELSTLTPMTFWSLSDFFRQAPRAGLWRVRSIDGSGVSRAALDFKGVVGALAGQDARDYVIQQMLTPSAAGATAILSDGKSLSEWVHGDAQSLLRDGSTGIRMLVQAGSIEWVGRGARSDDVEQLLRQIAAIQVEQQQLLLEWIVDATLGFFWVDMKRVNAGFLAELPASPIGVARSVGNRQAGSCVLLARPQLSVLDVLESSTDVHTVTFKDGSPLAHVCTRLHAVGVSVEVRLSET